jgi:methylated-DNA-[protein]-cysteine S-methyltransferase
MKDSIKYVIFKTKWGYFGLAANIRGLVRTCLPCPDRKIAQKYLLAGFHKSKFDKNLLKPLQKKIIAYFEGRCDFSISNQLSAISNFSNLAPFTRKVLAACAKIPYGKTVSYSQLARKAGNPLAARAVGNALAKNPLPLVIPCHRVICADGSIGKFSAFLEAGAGSQIINGKALKLKFLQFEQAI